MRSDIVFSPWRIENTSKVWEDNFLESIFFTGNGRMGVRGYLPFASKARPVQEGLFVAGIFGEIKPGITDFVNLPTPVYEKLLIDGKEACLSSPIMRTLDLKEAIFTASFSLSADNKTVDIEYQRFFPRDKSALFAQRIVLRPRGEMSILLDSGILTDSCNCPIPDDQTKDNDETVQLSNLIDVNALEDKLSTEYLIRGTNLKIKQDVSFNYKGLQSSGDREDKGSPFITFKACGEAGKELILDKLSCILTSRDVDSTIAPMPEIWSYESLLKDHKELWDEKWKSCDLVLPKAEVETQAAVRYVIYQLIVNCSGKDPTVSIGARGLTHSRYKGCYFWDTDMFMLPFYMGTDIEAARNLCEYRYRNLESAKEYARKMNSSGARYPWMASFDGSEQCESWDIGSSEVHITADVAFALAQYCKASEDKDFYINKAAEVFVETARFWCSRYSINREEKRADLLFCKGPDEYCGITSNNLFTNVMVQYNLKLACKAAEDLKAHHPELWRNLNLSQEEIDFWQEVQSWISWPHDPVTGRLTTDDTFHLLEPVDVNSLKVDAGASYHHVCFDRLQRYKVVKQADVLLLMTRLPELFTKEEKISAWKDFEPLCLHDSTLSFASHALFAQQNGLHQEAEDYLKKALFLDLKDIMGNTGKEGLHLAGMGEVWQVAALISQGEMKN